MDTRTTPLTAHLTLRQASRGHRTATDDVLCAWAGVRARPGAHRILDLGAGHGAVTLLLAQAIPGSTLVAVEVQEVSHKLLQANVAANGLGHRIQAIHSDLRHFAPGGFFDLVTGSPPFIPPGRGVMPANPQRAAARFELRGGIEDYCQAAARALAPGGAACFLMDGAQDRRSREALASAGLHLEWRLSVDPREGSRPRFLVYVASPTRPPEPPTDLPRERSLTIRDRKGSWTPEFTEIRGDLDLPGARPGRKG